METDKAKLYFQRLRLLLIAVFMLVALVPLVSFGYIGISQGKQMIQEKAAVYLMNLSGRNAQSIVQFMMERANDINALASLFHLSDKTFEPHIRQVKADPNRPYLDFYILDGAGRPVFTTADAGKEPGVPDLSEDLRPLWKGICIHPLVPGPAKGGAVLMLSRRLSGTGADRPAYLVALVDFLFIDRLMRENTMEDTGEVYLVDQGGGFLSSSRFGAKALETRMPDQAEPLAQPPVFQTTDYRGKAVLQARQPIPAFGWKVVADQDMTEILNQIQVLEKKGMVYALVTGCVVFALAFFISSAIANMVKEKYQREKAMEFQVIQKEKLAALGLLTSGLAHELNTPLANALLYTQIALEELADDPINPDSIRQHLSTVIDEVKQGSGVVKNLLYFSRHTQRDAETVNCNRLLTRLMEITIPHCVSKGIEVKTALENDMPEVLADASTLQSILTNLVANAIEAMPRGGTLSLKSRFMPALKLVRMEVADSGAGISPEALSHIFNPFYTTKAPGQGTGLGLFISREMARKLGGDVKVVSATRDLSKRSGTIFTLELPSKA